MKYAYSIIMGAFAAVLLIYAVLLALSKDYNNLPFRSRASVEPRDKKQYAVQLAKVIAFVALAPALSAIVGFWNKIAAAVVLIVSFIILILLGTKIMKKVA